MTINTQAHRSIVLQDCRRLAFAEYGPAKGKPVIHCNGSGGSRLEWPGDKNMLDDVGVRFIAIDRPEHGRSDPQENRRLLDWPNDVAQLVDHLGIQEFYVEGWSAGGAYALACAHELSERVLAGAILSGIGPYDRPNPLDGLDEPIRTWMDDARNNPEAVYPFREMMAQAIGSQSVAQIGAMLASGTGEDDKAVAMRPELQNVMGLNIKEGYRQGAKGPADDDIIINSPWGFRLQDIQTRFDVWQGEVDQNVPLAQGEYQHSILPNSKLHVLKNTAHLFPLVRWREILIRLTG
jgi:pimeloyl-ACP methyl ester carboxylesterase